MKNFIREYGGKKINFRHKINGKFLCQISGDIWHLGTKVKCFINVPSSLKGLKCVDNKRKKKKMQVSGF